MDDLLVRLNELCKEHERLKNRYLDVLNILNKVGQCYPYILKELVTKEQIDEILGG